MRMAMILAFSPNANVQCFLQTGLNLNDHDIGYRSGNVTVHYTGVGSLTRLQLILVREVTDISLCN